jgi:hypothetical protein
LLLLELDMPQLELQELTAAKLERATQLQSEETRQRQRSGSWLLAPGPRLPTTTRHSS